MYWGKAFSQRETRASVGAAEIPIVAARPARAAATSVSSDSVTMASSLWRPSETRSTTLPASGPPRCAHFVEAHEQAVIAGPEPAGTRKPLPSATPGTADAS